MRSCGIARACRAGRFIDFSVTTTPSTHSIKTPRPILANPITQAAFARLARYGLHRVLSRVMDGEVLRLIAADPDIGCSRPVLSQWLLGGMVGCEPGGEVAAKDRRRMYDEARRLSAPALVEDGLEQLDGETDPKMAQLANYRAQFRLKLAEKYDKEGFGAAQQKITVNIGDMHLDALRKRQVSVTVEIPQLESGEPDVELVQEEEQLKLLGG